AAQLQQGALAGERVVLQGAQHSRTARALAELEGNQIAEGIAEVVLEPQPQTAALGVQDGLAREQYARRQADLVRKLLLARASHVEQTAVALWLRVERALQETAVRQQFASAHPDEALRHRLRRRGGACQAHVVQLQAAALNVEQCFLAGACRRI